MQEIITMSPAVRHREKSKSFWWLSQSQMFLLLNIIVISRIILKSKNNFNIKKNTHETLTFLAII
jgi:hypothetical protein